MNHNNVPMTEILPYLYLGNRSDANNVTSLTDNGIGFILNLTTSATEYPKESKIIALHINILDSVYQCLKDTYQSAFDFIDEAQECNSKVLIHCEAGISRSPTITVAYLIYKKKMEALEAYNFVKKLRPIVSPNFGFMGQLMELENELLPEKVKLRLEKEAIKLKEELSKVVQKSNSEETQNQPFVEKLVENNINKLQLNIKPNKIAVKPTSLNIQITHKKPIVLPKPLSIDLQSTVLNAANKYILPSNDNTNLEQMVSNQNVNLNLQIKTSVTTSNEQIPIKTTNSIKNSQQNNIALSNSSNISSLSVKTNKDCPQKDDQQMIPKSTSPQPQLTLNKSNKLITNDKLTITKLSTLNTNQANNCLNTSSLPNSTASTPPFTENRQQSITPVICLSNLLKPNTKSISQNSIFPLNSSKLNGLNNNCLTTTTINSSTNCKPQIKPLRPSTLLLNSNVPRKTKHNAITPSSLCSPLTAFAVSSAKSSPTFHLSSPFEISEKLTKRRWETAETTSFKDLSKDFNPPDCKKKNKQKKLKNITVEVN